MSDPRPDRPDEGSLRDGSPASGPSIPAELVEPGSGPDELDDESAFDLGEVLGGAGLDLGGLMEQAAEMQQQMAAAQAAAADTVLEGVAGGGAVRIEVTGTGEFRSVRIDPTAVDADDVPMLEDLVLAALHDASARVAELQAESQGGLGGLLGPS